MHYFFYWKTIFFVSNDPFNTNVAILERKMMYFYLRSNFRGRTTLKTNVDESSISQNILEIFFHYQNQK